MRSVFTSSSLLAAGLLLGLLHLFSSCGFGTEVGNGAREEDREGGPEAAKGAASDSPPEENHTASEKGDTPAQDSAAGGESAPASPTAAGAAGDDILLASCASPFADDITLPVTLTRAVAGSPTPVTLTVTQGASEDLREIHYGDGKLLSRLSLPGDGEQQFRDQEGRDVGSGYQCATAITRDEIRFGGIGTVRRTRVTLTKDGVAITLQWFVLPANGQGGTAGSLVEIDARTQDGKLTYVWQAK